MVSLSEDGLAESGRLKRESIQVESQVIWVTGTQVMIPSSGRDR